MDKVKLLPCEFLAVAHENAKKPLVALDIRTGNVGRQGVMWVETTTALAAIKAAIEATRPTLVTDELVEPDECRLCGQTWERRNSQFPNPPPFGCAAPGIDRHDWSAISVMPTIPEQGLGE